MNKEMEGRILSRISTAEIDLIREGCRNSLVPESGAPECLHKTRRRRR